LRLSYVKPLLFDFAMRLHGDPTALRILPFAPEQLGVVMSMLPNRILELREMLKAPSIAIAQEVLWLIELSMECARAGLADEGLVNAKKSIELAERHHLAESKADALNAAAMCHYFRGDNLMTIACGIDAYQTFANHGEHAKMGHILATIAASCKEVNAYDLAEQALRACMTIADRANDRFLKSRAQNMLGIMLGQLHRFDEADTLLWQAVESLLAVEMKQHIPKVIASRGNLHKTKAEVAIANNEPRATIEAHLHAGITLVEESIQMARDINNPFDVADKTGTLGEYHFLLGEYAEATRLLDIALQLGRDIDHPHLIAESHLFLGRIAHAKNHLDDACRWLKQGLEFAKQRDVKVLQPKIHEELAAVLEKLGRTQEASIHHDTARQSHAELLHMNQEITREARLMWQMHFSHHPLIAQL
jgi:tetratricopeptide (TPR) repeat protein